MKTYRETFDYLYHNRPSTDLVDRINSRINHVISGRAKRRAFVCGICAIGSLVAMLPIFQYAIAQATSSGLYDYASLFVSDSGYIWSNWKTTGLSILESLPMLGITITIISLLISSYALKKTSDYVTISRVSGNTLLTT